MRSWQSNQGWQYDPGWQGQEAAHDQFDEVARTDDSGWQGDDAWQSHNWQRKGWQEPGWQGQEAAQDQYVRSSASSVRQRLGLLTIKAKAGVAGSGKED